MKRQLLGMLLAVSVSSAIAGGRPLVFSAPALPSAAPAVEAPAPVKQTQPETLATSEPTVPARKKGEPDLSGYDFADKIRLKAKKCIRQYVPLEEFADAIYPLVEKTMLIVQPKKPSLSNLFSGDTLEYLPKELAICDSVTWKAIAYDMLGLAEPPDEKSQDAEVPIPLELRKGAEPSVKPAAKVTPVKSGAIPVGKPLPEASSKSAKAALPPPLPKQ